ncbi:MAG: hypothetical protein N3B10_02235 [Armatimonadetes bacterium]|nr:hypothetical protein [Armatimonadota bacterium]MCX7967289.1 hypothetical protein [Armatimonadota bacterium]MDW8141903.1 hypothetical protein [Armatimonadota bacterium]
MVKLRTVRFLVITGLLDRTVIWFGCVGYKVLKAENQKRAGKQWSTKQTMVLGRV